MRKIIFATLCGLQVLVLRAQDEKPYMVKTFPRTGYHTVESVTSGGNIAIFGDATGEARVEVFVNSGNRHHLSKEEIDHRIAELYDLTVGIQGDRLVGDAKRKKEKERWEDGLSFSFVFHVPEAVSTNLRTSGGNIEMKRLSGTQDFKTSGGNLDLDGLSGKIIGKTSGGNIDLRNSKDNIDLTTSGGNVEAVNCSGVIRLGTSGGNVHLVGLKGDIHARTSGGEVDGENIAGELKTTTSGGNIDLRKLTCSLSASTSGGNIDLSIVELGKYVDLSNSSGDITMNLPKGKGVDLDVRGESLHFDDMANFHGSMDKHHAAGSLNGGGVPVKVDGSSSSVHVSFR